MANSKQKGNRGEREVVKLLKEYWDSKDFMKSPESGAMSTMMEGRAPADIVARLAGDILGPADFPFCVESKLYKEIDLWGIIRNPRASDIGKWWVQCSEDADRVGKVPLLTFREDRKKRFAAVRQSDYDKLNMLRSCERGTGFGISVRLNGSIIRIMNWDHFTEAFPKDEVLKEWN